MIKKTTLLSSFAIVLSMGTEEVLETRENEAEAIELAQTAEPTESMDDYP